MGLTSNRDGRQNPEELEALTISFQHPITLSFIKQRKMWNCPKDQWLMKITFHNICLSSIFTKTWKAVRRKEKREGKKEIRKKISNSKQILRTL